MARRNYAVIRLRPAGSGETRSLLGAVRWVRACRVSTAFPRPYRPFKKALSRSPHPACAPDDVYLSGTCLLRVYPVVIRATNIDSCVHAAL